MLVERNKTYIAAGGYVVKLDYNLCAPGMSPGQNEFYCSAGSGGWNWEKDGRIRGLTPEWMEKLKIVEDCPFDLPTPPDGYRWINGFPQVRIPKKGEYFLSYDSRTKSFSEVKCCDGNYITPYGTDGRRLILDKTTKATQEWPKYYKRGGDKTRFDTGLFVERDKSGQCHTIKESGDFSPPFEWEPKYHDKFVKQGDWIEVSKEEVDKELKKWAFDPSLIRNRNNSVTSVSDVSSSKKAKDIVMKKETAINVVTGVAKFAGKWGWRTVNYWAFEPATEVITKVMRAVRYVTLTGAIVGGVYAYNNPDKAVDLIKSCLPKITVEAPEIMQG